MNSAKALLGSVLGRFVFREAVLARADQLSTHFRRLTFAGPGLRGAAWTPGDKVQIFLPGVGMRTYTPTRWDGEAGETEFVIYLHGESPGARWAHQVAAGDAVQLFGPRGSLPVGRGSRAIVFGDETSVGLAVANGAAERAVLEVSDAAETGGVLRALGLTGVTVIGRESDGSHHPALVDALASAAPAGAAAPLVLSGRAGAIQAVRQGLKARNVSLSSTKSKAYWAPGKVGLD
jgi:NADPH-dependent ferric siderophore reductase